MVDTATKAEGERNFDIIYNEKPKPKNLEMLCSKVKIFLANDLSFLVPHCNVAYNDAQHVTDSSLRSKFDAVCDLLIEF